MAQASILAFATTAKRKEAPTTEDETAKRRRAAEKTRALSLLRSLRCEEWRAALEPEADKKYLFDLMQFVAKERSKATVFPPEELTFAALNECPLSRVRVVVVGQDPYHGPGQANGLAFSIAPDADCKFPPSLRNILEEVGLKKTRRGDLSKWAAQGVLLLNACLTVRSGAANSHQNKGWELFTDAVVRAVVKRPQKPVVFLLWGKHAQQKCASLPRSKYVKCLLSSHPSPLSNAKTSTPFTGSRCFAKCNALLAELSSQRQQEGSEEDDDEEPPIDWSLL